MSTTLEDKMLYRYDPQSNPPFGVIASMDFGYQSGYSWYTWYAWRKLPVGELCVYTNKPVGSYLQAGCEAFRLADGREAWIPISDLGIVADQGAARAMFELQGDV